MFQRIEKKLRERRPFLLGSEEMHKAAVMLPLLSQNGEIGVLLEVRANHLKRQPGEVCFPGGRVDPADPSEEEAAIRETMEELGIQRDQIHVLGPLDLLVTYHRELVYPFVCSLAQTAVIQPNPEEVAEVFFVPLAYLCEASWERYDVSLTIKPPSHFPYSRIAQGKNYPWRAGTVPEYFLDYQGRTIWGLTARILHHFITELKGEVSHG